jgi:hypothetical protein
MSKVLVGVFVVVFVGALAYEVLNRTKPGLAEQFEIRCSKGLDSLLKPSGAKA